MSTKERPIINGSPDELLAYAEQLEARAALAQSVPDGPTDEELGIIYHDSCRGCEFMDQGGFEDGARAAIALDRSRRAPVLAAEGEEKVQA